MINEGFDNYDEIAKELIKRHGKNIDTGHINDLAGERDTHRGLDHAEVMHHVNKHLKSMEEENVYDEKWKKYTGKSFKKESRMLKFNDYLKEAKLSAKQKKIAALAGDKDKIDADDLAALRAGKKPTKEEWKEGAGTAKMNEAKKCMDEDDMDESGLRMAAHAAHKEGKTSFEFQGKTYPVKVQKEGVLKPELEKGFPARGVKTGASAPKGTTYMPKKDVKEEVEQIDELSKKTLAAYVNRSANQAIIKGLANPKDDSDDMKTIDKREKGIRLATAKLSREEVELDEGRMKDLAYDLDNMGHDEFHKHYGKPKSYYDPSNFKKPVQKGHEMDRAKALAQRGIQSLSKEEVERIEEKAAQIDEISKKTLGSYVKKASHDARMMGQIATDFENRADRVRKPSLKDSNARLNKKYLEKAWKRDAGISKAVDKLTKEEVQIEESYPTKQHFQAIADIIKTHQDPKKRSELAHHHAGVFKGQNPRFDHARFMHACGVHDSSVCEEVQKTKSGQINYVGHQTQKSGDSKSVKDTDLASQHTYNQDNLSKHLSKHIGDKKGQVYFDDADLVHYDKTVVRGAIHPKSKHTVGDLAAALKKHVGVKEEVQQEESPYLKATLAVMDESKYDDYKDMLRAKKATQSAYDKDFKPDTTHPHIQVVKGTQYGGENQKDDENDEKPDETKEKRGRGRPAGSKSGARLKGNGREDGGIPVHNLHLPKSYK